MVNVKIDKVLVYPFVTSAFVLMRVVNTRPTSLSSSCTEGWFGMEAPLTLKSAPNKYPNHWCRLKNHNCFNPKEVHVGKL